MEATGLRYDNFTMFVYFTATMLIHRVAANGLRYDNFSTQRQACKRNTLSYCAKRAVAVSIKVLLDAATSRSMTAPRALRPYAKRQTPNAKRQTPNAKRQTPNAKRPAYYNTAFGYDPSHLKSVATRCTLSIAVLMRGS